MAGDATGEVPVLAIYDFRSKQEYIYRTNRMREITGASERLAGMYKHFAAVCVPGGDVIVGDKTVRAAGGTLRWDWDGTDAHGRPCERRELLVGDTPNISDGELGIVVYEGGGNLCVLYRNRAEYINANRTYSKVVLELGYSLSLVAGCADWVSTGDIDADFRRARQRAYRALDVKKRTGRVGTPCNVLPFTQVDAVNYQPIIERGYKGGDRIERSQEAMCKEAAWAARAHDEREADVEAAIPLEEGMSRWEREGRFIDELGTHKGDDSLIAVTYFDGNSIGNRLKDTVSTIDDMRSFSCGVHEALVTKTETAIREAISSMPDERQRGYRIIVDHGDEITLICNAHAAPVAVQAYFEALAKDARDHADDDDYKPYHACAGIAFCHAHDPFSEVYRIAEECCESGKERNRDEMRSGGEEASYVDFHFCRSGITGSLTQIRSAQEGDITARPYRIGSSYEQFLEVGGILAKGINEDAAVGSKMRVRRADAKALSRAILRGDSWYSLELERMRAKDGDVIARVEDVLLDGDTAPRAREHMRNVLFDVTSHIDVFDVLFSQGKGGKGDE